MIDLRREDFDVIVIGGGPAGSTAATLLAKFGHKVVMLERKPFPRYHVGESLLPCCYRTLERIDMIDKMRNSHFVKKYSVQFASVDGKMSQPFYFSEHMKDDPAGQTWQVIRSEFDQMLLDNAIEHGVDVRIGASAKELLRDNGNIVGITAEHDGIMQEFRAPLTIDCSGRDGFAINRLGWRQRDPQLSKIALWTYFKGGTRDTGIDEGATTVATLPQKGWFWHIPLPNDVISLGIVGEADYLYREGKDLHAIFQREMQTNAWIVDRMKGAEQYGEIWVTGDYSYRARHSATDGLVLAGDAFAFLDPVFSSGVFLAITSGGLVADAADSALKANDTSAEQFTEYTETLISGIEAMRKLVYAFYDENFSVADFLSKYPHLRAPMTDCLIGDLFKDFNELFSGLEEFAELPPLLSYGRPLVGSTA